MKRKISANTLEEPEIIWQTLLMNEWDIEKPVDVRWSWRKFDYEYYFIAKKKNNATHTQLATSKTPKKQKLTN